MPVAVPLSLERTRERARRSQIAGTWTQTAAQKIAAAAASIRFGLSSSKASRLVIEVDTRPQLGDIDTHLPKPGLVGKCRHLQLSILFQPSALLRGLRWIERYRVCSAESVPINAGSAQIVKPAHVCPSAQVDGNTNVLCWDITSIVDCWPGADMLKGFKAPRSPHVLQVCSRPSTGRNASPAPCLKSMAATDLSELLQKRERVWDAYNYLEGDGESHPVGLAPSLRGGAGRRGTLIDLPNSASVAKALLS